MTSTRGRLPDGQPMRSTHSSRSWKPTTGLKTRSTTASAAPCTSPTARGARSGPRTTSSAPRGGSAGPRPPTSRRWTTTTRSRGGSGTSRRRASGPTRRTRTCTRSCTTGRTPTCTCSWSRRSCASCSTGTSAPAGSSTGRTRSSSRRGAPLLLLRRPRSARCARASWWWCRDHHLILWPFRTALDHTETLDDLVSGRLSVEDAVRNKDPRLGWNAVDASGKVRPSKEDVEALGPEFKAAWDRDFRDRPNRPLAVIVQLSMYVGPQEGVEPGQYMTMGNFTAYPYSRGHLHITGPEVDDPLDFNVGFFSDEGDVDVKKQMWAYKKSRELMRRTSMYRGELASAHPPFPPHSEAACVAFDEERDTADVQDIKYSPEDDKILEQFVRENVNTTWHSIGTAKMAPRDDFGVVDKDLNVYGVKGLKLADLSIAPENVGANTNNTALVIGEKAADIILRELGLA
ncbi:putative GMC oxidoreductase [Rosellinia necatrix]|uniref:Putative GMC oxidoreductase n=1 Tax=Rosellinia necatrix TaxID=77044 RepID=A0A1S7UNH3_ROSNE|nr:putative GMC oxidoreductase [Rosellinia necatrix]